MPPRCGPRHVCEPRRESLGGDERLADVEQLLGRQPAAARGAVQRGPDVARAADRTPAPARSRSRSASSVWSWRSADVGRVGHRQRVPAPARARARTRCAAASCSTMAANSSARSVAASAAPPAGRSAAGDVRVIGDPEAQRARRPRRRRSRRRCAAPARSRWVGGPSRGSTATGPSSRSAPLRPRSTPRALPTLPGPEASRRSGTDARRDGCRASVDALVERKGADEHRLGLVAWPGHDVEAVVQPVDEVHVQVARRPEHHRVPGGPAARRVRREVLGAAVGLDLDDAPADRAVGDPACTQPAAEQVAGEVGRGPIEPGSGRADGRRFGRRGGHGRGGSVDLARDERARPGSPTIGMTRRAEELDDDASRSARRIADHPATGLARQPGRSCRARPAEA